MGWIMKLFNQQKEKHGQILPFLQTGDSLYHRGLLAYQKRDFDKAIYFMEKAINLKADDPIFYCQLAAVYAEVGNYERSNELLYKVLAEIDAEMYECYFFLANNYAYLGMFEKAEEMAFYYIDYCPDGEFANDCKLLLKMMQYDFDELEDWSEETLNEEVLIIRHDQADVYLQQGKYELAIEQYDKMIAENPCQWSAYNHKAQALFASGKVDEAIQLTFEVLASDEGNLFSLCNLAYFYFAEKRLDEANNIATELYCIEPILLEQRMRLAETFTLLERYDRAYEHLMYMKKKLFYLDDADKFHECFAVCAYHLGYVQKAIMTWKQLASQGHEKAKNYLTLYENDELAQERVKYDC